jgi:hypothetical protein
MFPDGGSNFQASWRMLRQSSGLYDAIRCACHCINLVLKDGIETCPAEDPTKRLLDEMSVVVTYYKRKGHDNELDRTLKQRMVRI